MIVPEQTEHRYDHSWITYDDRGAVPHRIYCIVEIPEVGSAGHLGVIEERCDSYHGFRHDAMPRCPECGATP
ncbi:hypothetical protein [Kribbella sindirgiensis]|uniref:Uncharacterized protein n=1 Tax=Kribbella sindirgiensis TaxID=1124744 RepID=A0A4R0I3I8_9ACTN|nr:hypothetical protein [Kribbella sindirgiensis]TCC19927.1 hypothetical protein E0H50_37480 [Kribbella sindirgiensis]